jgi:hypothetical protein
MLNEVKVVIENCIIVFIHLFAFCDIYTVMFTVYVAVLQDLFPWFMKNCYLTFLLFASRIFPDTKMESIVKRNQQTSRL